MKAILWRVLVCLATFAPLGGCCCPCSSGEDLEGGAAEADGPGGKSAAGKKQLNDGTEPEASEGKKLGEMTVTWAVPAGTKVKLQLTKKYDKKFLKRLEVTAQNGSATFDLKNLSPGQFTAGLSAKSDNAGKSGSMYKRLQFTVKSLDAINIKPISPDKPTITTLCSFSGLGEKLHNHLGYTSARVPIDDKGVARFSITMPDYAKKLKLSKPAKRISKQGDVVRVQAPLFESIKDKRARDFASGGVSNTMKLGTLKTDRGPLEFQMTCFMDTKRLGGKALPLPFDQPKTKPYSLMYEVKRDAKSSRSTYEFINGDQPLTALDFIGTITTQSKKLSGCAYKGSGGAKRVSRTQWNQVLTIYDRRTGKQVKKTVVRAATPKCSQKILSGRSSFSTFVSEDKIRETFKKMATGLR